MSRPTFHQIYMALAESLSARSTCQRLRVGCVIASPDFRKIYSIGYNGNVSGGANDCDRHGEAAIGNCGCLHAEENAVINCDVSRGFEKIVFCTHLPCLMCGKRLVNVGGVKAVFYRNDYRNRESLRLLHTHHIEVGHLELGDDVGAARFKAQQARTFFELGVK
jgi:dCMP deaminase